VSGAYAFKALFLPLVLLASCFLIAFLGSCLLCLAAGRTESPIDRFALVTRHNLRFQGPRPENVLTVGNGNFAFTTDVTGLQTFPEFHHQGIPLTTMANWAWHSYPNPKGYSLKDVQRPLQIRGATRFFPIVGFPFPNEESDPASQWLNQNPHRFSLGQIGLVILKNDGAEVSIEVLKNTTQELDLWSGTIHSSSEIEGILVRVATVVHPDLDLVASSIQSDLVH
jgi:hypothetical protein